MQKTFLFLLRITLGWLYFYAGITKVLNPGWSASGYLKGAKAFTSLYQWLALPGNIIWVDIVNKWGLTLLGVSLILGVAVRYSALFGVVLMVLYYLALGFPHPNVNSYIVDEHIIYSLVLLLLAASQAGKIWGMDGFRKAKK